MNCDKGQSGKNISLFAETKSIIRFGKKEIENTYNSSVFTESCKDSIQYYSEILALHWNMVCAVKYAWNVTERAFQSIRMPGILV